jgi:hypothetical protein
MEALSSETSFLTRATLRNIPKDAILHSHRCENLKSYIFVVSLFLKLKVIIKAGQADERQVTKVGRGLRYTKRLHPVVAELELGWAFQQVIREQFAANCC